MEKDYHQKQNGNPSVQQQFLHKVPSSCELENKSRYYENYLSYLRQDTNQLIVNQVIQSSLQQLSKNKITYNPTNFTSNISIINLTNTQNSIIANLLVTLSYFTFEIIVVNMSGQSVLVKGLPRIGVGSAGRILSYKYRESDIVIKSIKFSQIINQQSNQTDDFMPRTIKQAVKQYCFSKLFSVLEIGPKTYDFFGFDMIIFQDSVQFCLEKCLPIQNTEAHDQQSLKRDLVIIHGLKIIHGDIKCENIMFSREFDKPVFIDFGFSSALNQSIGEKTLTHYFGTYEYCSQQMRELLTIKTFGLIDLYYNDVLCLQKSIKKFSTGLISIYYTLQSHFQEQFIINFFNNLELMSLISNGNFDKISQFLQKLKLFHLLSETTQIISNLSIQKASNKIISALHQYGITKRSKFLLPNLNQNNFPELTKIKKQHSILNCFDSISFGWLMRLLLFTQNEDITPLAKQRKHTLGQTLKFCSKIDLKYCQALVQYVSNLYTSEKDIIDAFQITANLLIKHGYKQKFSKGQAKHSLYEHAFQVCINIYLHFSINLMEIYQKYTKLRQKEFKERNMINHTLWRKHFQNDFKNESEIQFNDCIIRIGPHQDHSCERKQQNFQITIINNYQRLICLNPDENSLLFHCMKFYPTSKCSFAILKAKFSEYFSLFQLEQQTYQLYQRQRSKISINRCFESQVLFIFSLANKIQAYTQKSFDHFEQETAQIKFFLNLFKPTTKIIEQYILWLQKRLFRIKQIIIGSNCKFIPKWVSANKQIFEQLLEIFLESKQLMDPGKIYIVLKLYLNLLKYLPKSNLRFFKYFTSQRVWAHTNILCCSNQDKIMYFYSKMVFPQLLNASKKELILKNIHIFIENDSEKEYQYSFILHNLCFQLSYLTGRIKQCERELQILMKLAQKPGQNMVLMTNLSFDPHYQGYLSLDSVKYSTKSFELLFWGLQAFHKSALNNCEKQLCQTLFQRKLIEQYLLPKAALSAVERYAKYFGHVLKQKGQGFWQNFGNSIVLNQMFLSTICKHKLFKKQADHLIKYLLKISLKLIPFSSFYIKKRFTDKFYIFIVKLINCGVIECKSDRKLYYFQLRQYRNSQYYLKKQKIQNLLSRTKFQWITKAKQNFKDKICLWNANKQKSVVIQSINVHSIYAQKLEQLLSQSAQ